MRLFPRRPGWEFAIAAWREAGASRWIESLILAGVAIPPEHRQAVADIVAGRAKRPRGKVAKAWRPYVSEAERLEDERQWLREWQVRRDFQEQLQGLRILREEKSPPQRGATPSEEAIERVAEKHGMAADQVRWIVYPRRRQGAK